jgi:AcrR family transcriptional regulator
VPPAKTAKPVRSKAASPRAAGKDVEKEILAEATHLFAARGVEATSLQDVADAVGVKKQSLLYHYASKDVLHRAVLEALLSRWNETLPRLLRAASREDRFDAILDETIGFFSEDPSRARLLLREALDRPAEMRTLLGEFVSPWLAVLSENIAKAQTAGVIRRDVDPEAYVVMVIHLVLGNVATAGTVSTIADKSRGTKVPERVAREIKRMARVALMNEPHASARAAE